MKNQVQSKAFLLVALCSYLVFTVQALSLSRHSTFSSLMINDLDKHDHSAHNASVFKNFNVFDGIHEELLLAKIVVVMNDEIFKIYDLAEENKVLADMFMHKAKLLKLYEGD
eukprot:Awhi_evm3s7682